MITKPEKTLVWYRERHHEKFYLVSHDGDGYPSWVEMELHQDGYWYEPIGFNSPRFRIYDRLAKSFCVAGLPGFAVAGPYYHEEHA